MVPVPARAGEHGLQCQFCRAHLLRGRHSGLATRVSGAALIAILPCGPPFTVQSGKPVQQVHEHLQVHFEETDARLGQR